MGETSDKVKEIQLALLSWNKNCLPKYGADGNYGAETKNAIMSFQAYAQLPVNGFYDEATDAALKELPAAKYNVKVTGGTVNVRSGPGTTYAILGVVKKDSIFEYLNQTKEGWMLIDYNGQNAWIKNTLSTLI